MNISDLSFWLSELSCPIVQMDGYIFLDRNSEGQEFLARKINAYPNFTEAQKWINLVPLGDFITEAVGPEWTTKSPEAHQIAEVYAAVFRDRIRANFPDTDCQVSVWLDEEPSDIGIGVTQNFLE